MRMPIAATALCLLAGCASTHFGHAALGMKGKIVVQGGELSAWR